MTFKEETTFIFEADVNPQWAEGLKFCDTLVKLRKGVMPFIIIDVQNPTDHDIVLVGRTVIETVQPIQAVYPASVFAKSLPASSAVVSNVDVEKDEAFSDVWDPPIDLNYLFEPEKEVVQKC